MNAVVVLALKDLRLLPRVRMALFFTIVFPVIVAVMFGYAFGGPGEGEASAIRVALVDEDATDGSRAFVKRLHDSGQFDLAPMARDEAEAAVRRGQRAAFLVLKPGFGAKSARMFYGDPREIEVGADPSRKAEAGMIEGLLMKAAAEDMQRTLSDPKASSDMVDQALGDLRGDPNAPPELGRFLGELKAFVASPATQQSGETAGPQWQPLKVTAAAVVRERPGPANPFEITFPQGVLWALLGCMMSFGVSLVSERTRGTLVRLAMSPLSRAQILGGKALACLASMVAVQALLYVLGFFVFGVRPASWPLLVMASLSATVAFCGLMMLVATLGTTEQAASGTAWAIMMPLSMVGGGMVPQFLMPGWMLALGNVSPVKWAILAIEGALWRGFTLAEMALPCAILVVVGLACFALGTRRLQVA
ncbi:MAG: ABC transporter permease [Acidobacteria bacterium]|nr:ABC transporter permease [Acidobacteriota bacterium]